MSSLPNDLLLPDIKTCNLDSKKEKYFLKGLVFSPCQRELSNTTGVFLKTSALELLGRGWRGTP